MANRYWVGNSGSWSDTSHWSDTSGGSSGFSAPSSSDNVYIDANSFTTGSQSINVNTTGNCLDFDTTGVLNNPAILMNNNINVYGNFKIVNGISPNQNSFFDLKATSTGKTIYAGGRQPFIRLDGVGGEWTLQDTYGATGTRAGGFYITNGSFIANSKTINCNIFSSNNTNTRTIDITNSSIYTSGFTMNVSNLTLTTTGSLINVGASGSFYGGGATYNVVQLVGGVQGLYGSNTFATLTRTGLGSGLTDSLLIGDNQTVTGTLTINGSSAISRVIIKSDTAGTQRTLTAATVTVTNADFQDIIGAGAGSWELSNITGKSGDCGGNSNITFTTPTTTNWQSGTTWSTATWSVRVPLPQDTATFTTAGTATITQDMPRIGAVDFTGSSNKTWTTSTACSVYGSINLTNLTTLTNSTQAFTIEARGNITLTSAGKTWNKLFTLANPGGKLTLLDDFVNTNSGNGINQTGTTGEFDANDFNITMGGANFSSAGTIRMGNGLWTLNIGTANPWTVSSATIVSEGSTIKMTGALTADRTFAGGAKTYNNVWNATSGAYALIVSGSNVFNDFKINAGRSVKFTTGTTQTVTTFTATGTAGNLITIDSTTTGTHALAKAGGGTISCDYLSVQHSVVSPANTWYAGNNSTNNQSVATAGSGWLFESPVVLYIKTVAEVIAIASTLQNLSQKILAQSVTIASALRLGFIKDMFETITLSTTFIKYVSKPLSNALSVVSSFGSVGTFFRDMIEYLAVSEIFEKGVYKLQSFTETISIVSNTVKQGMKNMVDSLSVIDRLAKSISRILVDSITLVSNYINTRVKILTQSISVVDRVSKATSKVITNTISIASRLARSWGVILSKETITVAGSCVKNVFRSIINAISISALATIRITGFSIREAITISGSARKSISHKIGNAIAISSRLARGFFFRASGVISIADSIKKSPIKLLREILAINRSFSMKLNGVLLDLWSRATKSVTDTWTRATKTITDPWKRTPKN